jgi:hypothetical protein
MRAAILALVLSLFALFSSAAQQSVVLSSQALSILQHALAALSPNITTQDITLSGSAHYIAGSDDETGTAVLKATVIGSSRIDLSLSSGQRSEVYNFSAATPVGQWSGPDGSPHAVSYHNLLNEPGWFSPVTAISRRLASSVFVTTYIGAETLDSQSVQHISVEQQPFDSSAQSALLQHLTQIDLYLDSATFLPAAMSFSAHPDDDAGLDIPVLVRFSDYRAVSGANVPFHIQKYFNKTLVLDLQMQLVTVNSGLPASSFGIS